MRSVAGVTVYVALEQRVYAGLREVVVLRPENDTEALGRRQIEGRQHLLLPLGGRRQLQGDRIAGLERAALDAADPPARVGRQAAEHRRDIEPAFDREIGNRAARKRADAHDLAAAQPRAFQQPQALAAAGALRRHDLDRRTAAGDARCARCRPPPPAPAPDRQSPAPPCAGALPTSRLAARRLTWSSAPETGTPRC